MMRVPPHFAESLCAVVAVAGGLCLLVGSFIDHTWIYSHFVRLGCRIAGSCFILWGASALVLQFVPLSGGINHFLSFLQPRIGAAGLGIGFLLVVSGGFSKQSARLARADSSNAGPHESRNI
jgi:hypothetical protein